MLYNKHTVYCSRCSITYRLHTLYDLPIKGAPIYCAYCGVANYTHINRVSEEANNATWQEGMVEEFKQSWSILEGFYEVWLATWPDGTRFRDYLISIYGTPKK